MKKYSIIVIPALILIVFLILRSLPHNAAQTPHIKKQLNWWDIQSIDSVKYSRDLAREKAQDSSFDEVIDNQVRLISQTGATHIAIGTPYADEFLPFLKRWVAAARKYNLQIWFRGNLPGWEGWFNYPKINRDTHIAKIREFIISNGELFADGDLFSACPECENGGPGDPRSNNDISGHRKFLIKEYEVTKEAFRLIGKNVKSNLVPMNGDVAKTIMNKETTQALGGVVVIDHYVASGDILASDIRTIAAQSGGKILLGEFGAPIPDIHGNLNNAQQAAWINDALNKVSGLNVLIGLNYWTGFGGSTQLWNDNFTERPAVEIIKRYFKPNSISGSILNELDKPVEGARVYTDTKSVLSDINGYFDLPTVQDRENIKIEANNYNAYAITATDAENVSIILKKDHEDLFFKINKLIKRLRKK